MIMVKMLWGLVKNIRVVSVNMFSRENPTLNDEATKLSSDWQEERGRVTEGERDVDERWVKGRSGQLLADEVTERQQYVVTAQRSVVSHCASCCRDEHRQRVTVTHNQSQSSSFCQSSAQPACLHPTPHPPRLSLAVVSALTLLCYKVVFLLSLSVFVVLQAAPQKNL